MRIVRLMRSFSGGIKGPGLAFEQMTCWRQVKAGRNALLVSIPPTNDGCPILRALCEGWGTQVPPFNLSRKEDLCILRPGPPAQSLKVPLCFRQRPLARMVRLMRSLSGDLCAQLFKGAVGGERPAMVNF
jgi:hypothetical protein